MGSESEKEERIEKKRGKTDREGRGTASESKETAGVILQQSEWIICEKLWEKAPRTIMQLYHALKEEPGWSKSTVNTLLGRMLEKGLIYYEEGEKARQYYPRLKREDAALAETESLLKKLYKGSVGMMMSTLLQKNALSTEEIRELYEILERGR